MTKDIPNIVAQLADVQLRIRELQEVESELKGYLKDTLEIDEYEIGPYTLKVQPNRRINKVKAVQRYGNLVCSMQFDTATAKRFLSGEQLDNLYDEFDSKITLIVND